MANQHSEHGQSVLDYEEHSRIGGLDGKKTFIFDNAGNQITSFGGSPNTGNVTLNPSPNPIGIVTVANTVPVTFSGNVTLSDSKGFIGLVSIAQPINANVSLSASDKYIGLVTSTQVGLVTTVNVGLQTLAPSPNYIGLASVNIGGTLPALTAGAAYAGLMTIDIGTQNGVAVKGNVTLSDSKTGIGLVSIFGGKLSIDGNVTLSDPKGFIGLVSIAQPINANVSLGASAQFIGIVTIANSNARSLTGNVTLSDAKTYIGLTTTTLGVGTTFIGLVTAVTRNAGTNKTLIPKNLSFATSSITTIAVPSNTFYITKLVLNSNATVRLNIKSGATYLTGNASLGMNINPGGGWVETGAPDAPIYNGLAGAAAIVLEKADSSGVVSQIGGHLMYFDE